ncbi:1-phosphofructokinase [Abyssisolibacter fermentans]|uniref:1-phosphofructokinase n=1 Tax=Abyssisolibacter fermentans TaxID=1766203 RepID=UPI00082FC4F3|nr:1-phosphofructokinase [Abyssisolibacter fermentans]
MIYTITFNPSIDYILQVDNFKFGEVNRVKEDYKYPGGKGINVSRVLNNLNVKSKALGFIGGFTGEYISKFLENEGVDTGFIRVEGDTRINVKLKTDEETEINCSGSEIKEDDLNKLFKEVERLTKDDFVVLAGNIQKTLPRDCYSQVQKICLKNKVKVVVDTTGDALISTLKYNPFLIKPNKYELSEIFDTEIVNKEEIIYYAEKLIQMGARNVIISMAGEGALLICDEGVYHAKVPQDIVKNSVGAGDSLIGGFLANYINTSDIIEAFKWGVTCGSATAFSDDLCKKHDVEKLLDEIEISKIK